MGLRKRFRRLAVLAAVMAVAPLIGAAQPATAPQTFQHGTLTFVRDVTEHPLEDATVYVLPIRDAIFGDMSFRFHRMTAQAKAAGADAIVLDFDTPGGELGTMKMMLDEILSFDVPVYSFVNPEAISAGALLALGGDIIVMNPTGGSRIGDAYPITGSGQQIGEGSERVEEKILSYMRSILRSTANSRGHDPDLAQRMTDPDYPLDHYPGLVSEGEILTLTNDQATSVGLAALEAGDVEELLEKAGFVNPTIVHPQLNWSEKLAGYTVHPVVSSLLMLIALAAFYMEFKTPGVGVPLAVGLLALALFFWGKMLADLASYMELIIFLLGLLLIAVEVFVIPGFGVAGILGMACIIGSLVFSMANLPSVGFDAVNLHVIRTPLVVMAITMVLSVPMFMLLTKLLPETPLFRGLITDPNRIPMAREEDEWRAAPPKYMGKRGVAVSDLRPGGIVDVAGERLHVMTQGEWIEQGSAVKVVAERGNEIIVVEERGDMA